MKTGYKTGKDLAIDDEQLRKLNSKKVVDSIDYVGKYFKELKHQNRINFIVGLATGIIILIFLGGIIYSAYSAGGSFIDNIVDKNVLKRRYNCSNDKYQEQFRSAKEALEFKELYNNTECVFYKLNNGK